MRLRQDPPSVTQSQTRSRKRKTPPSADAIQSIPPPPPPASMQHTLPPAHTLVPPPHLPGHVIPPSYQYPPGDYPPAGLPPPHSLAPPSAESVQEQRPQSQASNGAPTSTAAGTTRTLSQSKRAEQNRKAQRAFRERRDQCVLSRCLSPVLLHTTDITFSTDRHVKALESRSQLLDAALASADEANRRWEECRALVDQLRIENAALRAALSQAQMMGSGGSSVPAPSGSDDNRSAPAPVGEGTKSAEEPKE
jgi:hypothetical protein